jgi:hypothetical protein
MKNFDYGKLLGGAWNIIWKNKSLWLFGFLTALAGEIGGNGSNLINLGNRFLNGDLEKMTEYMPKEWVDIIRQLSGLQWSEIQTYVFLGLGCCLISMAVLRVIGVFGFGGLIKGIQEADSGRAVSVPMGLVFGRRYFWRVFGIEAVDILIRMAAALVLILILFAALFGALLGGGFLLAAPMVFLAVYCPLFCCFLAGINILSFFLFFCRLSVVLEDASFRASFGRAAAVLRRSIGPVFILCAVYFVVALGVNFLGLLILTPAIGVFTAGLLPMIQQTGMVNVALVEIGLALFVIQIPISWWITAVWVSWGNALFSLFFLRAAEIAGNADAGRKVLPVELPTVGKPA